MAIAPNRPANSDAARKRRALQTSPDVRRLPGPLDSMNTVPEGKTDAPVYMGS